MDFKPRTFTNQEKENARILFKKPAVFLLGVANLSQLPEGNMPEIAFAGRSNVGKSSLLNALFDNKTIAKTSNTPGRTQQLNFFNLNNQLYLVDMPGYGYAKAPENMVKQWQKILSAYLQGRVTLKRVFLLIDSRHGLKQADTEIMTLLDKAAVTYQFILTKSDKASVTELNKTTEEIKKNIASHPAAYSEIIISSSEKKQNIDKIREEIYSLL